MRFLVYLGIFWGALTALVLALGWVIIVLALIAAAIQNRRKRHVANAFHCTRCGQLLGAKSVRLADKEFRKHLKELRRRYPFAKFRIVKTCHAICATCGMRYSYLSRERAFVPEARAAFR